MISVLLCDPRREEWLSVRAALEEGSGEPISVAWEATVSGASQAIRGGKQIMAEVGEGNLDWAGILAAARDAGVVWYIVEQDTCERDPFESLKISIENLKAMDHADELTPAECGLTADAGGPETAVTVELEGGESQTVWLSKENGDTFFALRPDRYDRSSVYRVPARVVGRIVRPPSEYARADEPAP